jgi:hypothetical protein
MADGDKSLQLRSTQKRKFERKSQVVVTTATAKVLRRGRLEAAPVLRFRKATTTVVSRKEENPQINLDDGCSRLKVYFSF